MNEKVLIVDDDMDVLNAYRTRLGARFDISTALGAAQGLEIIKEIGPIPVVVSDASMPGMDGAEFLRAVQKCSPDTARIMLTGNTDQATAADAVNEGNIFRFFTKPCGHEELAAGIDAGVKLFHMAVAERALLEETLAGSVKVLVDVLSLLNPYAFQKTRLLRQWAARLASELSLPNAWELDVAAMLSQIGLITILPENHARISQGEPLEKSEQEAVERAPEVARNLISNIPRMKNVSEMIYYQNKGFDGSGFPETSVAGEDIPIGGRILKVLGDLAAISDDPGEPDIDTLARNAHLYDPNLLSLVRSYFVESGEFDARPVTQRIVKIPLSRLQPGSRLVSNIETLEGTLILVAGTEVSPAHIERIRVMQTRRKLVEPVHVIPPDDDFWEL